MEKRNNGTKTAIKKKQRLQSGYFHVWLRGNSRFRVFYEDTDFLDFLTKCNQTANYHQSKITAFVLMDNHVHLQVYTENLTLFMTSLIIRYTKWFNKRKGLSGSLFDSPFSSSPLYSSDMLERNLLYILTNPVRAGICKSARDYPWSSYHAFMSDHMNPLSKTISVDCSVMKSLFSSLSELNRKADDFNFDYNKRTPVNVNLTGADNNIVSINDRDVKRGGVENGGGSVKTYKNETFSSNWHKVPDYEVAQHLKLLLQGRKLNEITKEEFKEIIRVLRYQGNATIQQIASLTHESYFDIRRVL